MARSTKNGTRTVGDLKPAPYNPRKIDAERLRMLGDSMGEFGDLSGIVFNRRTGRLIGGHQRIKHIPESAAVHVETTYEEPTQAGTVAEGFVEVAGERWVYREVDVDETREVAMNVAANKHGGEFEFGSLAELLSELDAGGFDMPLTGFTDEELEGLLVRDGTGGEDTADLTPPEEPKSKRGEIYELGPHRLMCGDSCDRDDIAALMDGRRAQLLFTDPPYGVSLSATKRKAGMSSAGSIHGDLTQSLLPISFAVAVETCLDDNARIYVCGGASNFEMFAKIFDHYLRMQPRPLIWVKESFVMRPNNYHSQYEVVYFGWKGTGGGPDYWYGDRKDSDVWQVTRDGDHEHPTQKPVELPAKAIRNSCPRGGIVLDMFAGSGPTLIAAEAVGRVCYAMELDPAYCDVIRRRYATYVGDESLMP